MRKRLGESFKRTFNTVKRLDRLGDTITKLAQDLEKGKPINPKRLKKLGGQVKWWNSHFFNQTINDWYAPLAQYELFFFWAQEGEQAAGTGES